jgi:predicted dehydrogenase
MSNNVNVIIVGAGLIAQEYVKVLLAQGLTPVVVTRGNKKAEQLQKSYPNIKVITGGLDKFLNQKECPEYAVVATAVEHLANATKSLIKSKCKHILVEKPLTCSLDEAIEISELAEKFECDVAIAFNRRAYQSVLKARELIKADGGVSSFHFDFTEAIFAIDPNNYGEEIPKYWGIANSSHVIDTAFYLGGNPKLIESRQHGREVSWHPSGSVFTGLGETEDGVPFTYHANWGAPGRWNIEITTKKRKLLFSPMERLRQQPINTFATEDVKIDYKLDNDFKPGFYYQVDQFLLNKPLHNYIDFAEELELLNKIFNY